MKFLYEYRTSDNARHEGTIAAQDRDAVFAALRERGIRPSRVVEAPGLVNKLFGKGKRWLAIVVLLVLCVVLGATALFFRGEAKEAQVFEDTTRRQVIGDAAIIQKGILDGWSDVFPEEGERFLAGFAVPGVPVSVRNTTEQEIREALKRRVAVTKDDTLEARQIKSMVEGMKDELRQFLKDGGSIIGYGQRLVQRQEEEIARYNAAKAEIDALAAKAQEAKGSDQQAQSAEALRTRWEEVNDRLRKMGIKLVAWPE